MAVAVAVAVRAAGYLPALCGVPAGESPGAGRGALCGEGGGGSPADCRCTGGKKRQNGPIMLGSCPLQSRCVTLSASAPSLDRRAPVCKVRVDWTLSKAPSSSPNCSCVLG